VKNVHHIKAKQRETNVGITNSVSQFQKSMNHTLLEEPGVQQQRRKWWRKFYVMVPLMEISKLQVCFLYTKKVFLVKKEWFIYTNHNKIDFWKWLVSHKLRVVKKLKRNLNSLTNQSMKLERYRGWTWITQLSLLVGEKTKKPIPNIGLLETLMVHNGVWKVISSSKEEQMILEWKLNRLHSIQYSVVRMELNVIE